MMKRSVVSIAHDGSSAKRKDRIRRGYGLNEDEILLSMDLHLVDSFEPLLGDQNPLVSHFRAHIQVKIKKGSARASTYCFGTEPPKAEFLEDPKGHLEKARAFRGGGGAP